MRLMPTSMTTAPRLDHVGRDERRRRRPRRRARRRRACAAARSCVCEWQSVTVAFACMQQVRHRLADDVAAADHDRARAVELDRVLGEHRHHAERRRRDERRPAEVELAGVERMEAVDVLRRRDRADDLRLVDVLRQRQLDEDRVDLAVARSARRPSRAAPPRWSRRAGAGRSRRSRPRSPPCA